MERKCAAIGIVVTIGLLALAGCSGASDETTELKGRVEQLQVTLEKTRTERDGFQRDAESVKKALDEAESKLAGTTEAKNAVQSQLQDLTRSRDDLQGKVEQFSTTSKQLQQRVDELTASRDQLQTQVATLTKARDAACADAVIAQTKIDQLNDKLKTQTQQMVDLQDQIKSIRSVLQQLQQKLE